MSVCLCVCLSVSVSVCLSVREPISETTRLAVVGSGSYDIYVGGKRVGAYNDSGFFGELALMYNQPRAATIIATSPGALWAMVRSENGATDTLQCCSSCSYW